VELDKLAYAASLTPFIPAGVEKYSREEAFKILREAPDPYEKFREIAKAANTGRVKLTEPWESLRVLIMPKRSEESRLIHSETYREVDEGKKKALFYTAFALDETFGVYRSMLRKYAEGLREAVQKREVGEESFKKVVYAADLKQIKQLAEEEGKAFEEALSALRKRLNEYAVKHGLWDLLDVDEDVARRLAESKQPELSKFNDVSFGTKAYAALIAYREYVLGRRGAYGTAAWYWLEVGGSARLLYYAPWTAYQNAKKARAEKPSAVEELVAEALRRLFLKPGADHHSFVEELTKGGRLAPELENKTMSSYVFKLFRLEEDGGLEELGIELWISKVGEGEGAGITYALIFDMERWRGFFGQELEAAARAAEEVKGHLPVEDLSSYMAGWVDSDVAIVRNRRGERVLRMTTSHLWQLAETHALFGWSVVGLRMTLTLKGPKLQVVVEAPLKNLDEAIRRSAEDGWHKMLGIKAESWEGLKRWVGEHWGIVVEAAVRRLGEGVRSELETLRDRLNDDKIAREVVGPALLLMQAERLGVDETTLRYFGAVISGAIGGDGHVSAAMKEVVLTSGEREVALLWGAVLAAYGIKAEVRRVGSAFNVVASGVGAARLARLYFLYGPPLLEGDDRLKKHKLSEAVELGAEGLDIRWERLRRRTEDGPVAADLTISEGGIAVKYNVYLSNEVKLQFRSADWSRVELAERLLRLAGVSAEVQKEGGRDIWYVYATTDMLAAGREELRKVLAEFVRAAVEKGWVDAGKAERWLEKLEEGRVLKEGWPKYEIGLSGSGALVVRFGSTSPNSIQQAAQQLREMGLEEGRHFTVKMPEEGRDGYVSILRRGLERAAWLSVRGKDEQQRRLAAEFVERILRRAEEAGEDVYEKVREIIEKGKARGSLTLKGLEKKVEMNGETYVVKVIDGSAEIEESWGDKLLLRIRITAEVNSVQRDYEITYSRRKTDNAALGFAVARADAPGGREADAERFSALIKALTGREPKVYRKSDGKIEIVYGRGHLDDFARYAELAEAIEEWLEKTGQ
jgi:hypothetical protein